MTIQDRWHVITHRCYEYSDNWYHHHKLLAEQIKQWRKNNTLKSVK